MAEGADTTSRRALLGAIAGAAVVAPVLAVASPTPGTPWRQAFIHYQALSAAVVVEERRYHAICDANGDNSAASAQQGKTCDRVLDEWSKAQTEVLMLPAGDLADLRDKLEVLLVAEEGTDGLLGWNMRLVCPALTDLRRLIA